MGFLSQSALMLSPSIKLATKAIDTALPSLLLEFFYSFLEVNACWVARNDLIM